MPMRRLITYSFLSIIALSGFFGSVHIETDYQDNRVVSVSYEGNGVYAAPPCNTGTTSTVAAPCDPTPPADQLNMWKTVIDTINMAFLVLSSIISPIILFVGWLMSPDWTSGDIFGLRTPMYSLWVTVSNIVYFVYAILLILIALGTMFGKESFSYKVMLPKLALGILMVPFTWWFVQWTISIASVVTASVMSIPEETIKESAWFSTTQSIPTKITVSSTGSGGLQDASKACPTDCITPKAFLANEGGMYGPLVVYAYSIFNVHQLTSLPTGIDIASAALNIVHQSLIGVLMFLVFGLLIIALTAILLVRAMKLWVYAIFSPLFTFQFVAGSAMMGGDKDNTFTIKEFVGLCFVPAIVGLSLSFGLIIISAIQSSNNNSSTNTNNTCNLEKEGCTIHIMGSESKNSIVRKWVESNNPVTTTGKDYITNTTITWGGMSWIFEGKAVNQSSTTSNATGTLDAIGGIFGTIIVDIIALVFIWIAFMAAKNVSKAVAMAVEPFEKIGKQVGSLAQSIPKYTPIPGLGMSMSGMEKGIGKVEQGFKDNRANEDAKSPLGQLLGLEAAARKETVKAIEAIRTSNTPTDEMIHNLRTQLSQETKGNKVEKTAEGLNAILERYSKKDTNTGKMTLDENNTSLIQNMKQLGLEREDIKKLKTSYENGGITKEYLKNTIDGGYVYKKMHPNDGLGETPKSSTAESTEGSEKTTTPESPKPESTKAPPTKGEEK